MAHHKSAKKRIRQNLKLRTRNRALRSTLRTALKKYRSLLHAKQVDEAQEQLPTIHKTIDKMVTKGVIHKNNANRKKSRLTRQLNRLRAA